MPYRCNLSYARRLGGGRAACDLPLNEKVPEELSATSFFREIVDLTLLRGAPESHELAREKRRLL